MVSISMAYRLRAPDVVGIKQTVHAYKNGKGLSLVFISAYRVWIQFIVYSIRQAVVQ